MASSERIESLPLTAAVKPRLRGVSHLFAFVAALGGCFFLALAPADGAKHTAGLVFGVSLVLMFGISATYHRPTWSRATYRRIQRFDHAAIYVLIAGTFTPLAVLDAANRWSVLLLWLMWGAALTGAALVLLGIFAPRGLRAALYVALGTVSFPVLLRLPGSIGWAKVAGLFFGAVLYALGAVVYARKWPNPKPMVFGYHELFHVMVIAAAAMHYAIILDVLWSR
jgi:hemolysin III